MTDTDRRWVSLIALTVLGLAGWIAAGVGILVIYGDAVLAPVALFIGVLASMALTIWAWAASSRVERQNAADKLAQRTDR